MDFVGATVVAVRYATDEEMEAEGWDEYSPMVVMEFDNGAAIYASEDEEGNGPGTLIGIDYQHEADSDCECDGRFYVEVENG